MVWCHDTQMKYALHRKETRMVKDRAHFQEKPRTTLEIKADFFKKYTNRNLYFQTFLLGANVVSSARLNLGFTFIVYKLATRTLEGGERRATAQVESTASSWHILNRT